MGVRAFIYLLVLVITMTGCVTQTDINEGFRRIDRVWQLDYQKNEDALRYRVVEGDQRLIHEAVRKTFLDLNITIKEESLNDGFVIGESDAPTPLTKEEWIGVVKEEKARVKEVGGWMFTLKNDPKGYIIQTKATMVREGDKTIVLIDYNLDMPKIREMGYKPSEHAPPKAVAIGSIKFWVTLKENLEAQNVTGPRKRTNEEVNVT